MELSPAVDLWWRVSGAGRAICPHRDRSPREVRADGAISAGKVSGRKEGGGLCYKTGPQQYGEMNWLVAFAEFQEMQHHTYDCESQNRSSCCGVPFVAFPPVVYSTTVPDAVTTKITHGGSKKNARKRGQLILSSVTTASAVPPASPNMPSLTQSTPPRKGAREGVSRNNYDDKKTATAFAGNRDSREDVGPE